MNSGVCENPAKRLAIGPANYKQMLSVVFGKLVRGVDSSVSYHIARDSLSFKEISCCSSQFLDRQSILFFLQQLVFRWTINARSASLSECACTLDCAPFSKRCEALRPLQERSIDQ